MSTPALGEIKLVSFNFAPKGWALCNGQLLPVNQNQALFSLLGVTYGGDGKVNFALPDLRGRAPIHAGSTVKLGATVGSEFVTLNTNELPSHIHTVNGMSNAATADDPLNAMWATVTDATHPLYSTASPNTAMSAAATSTTGGSQPHENRQPYLVMNYIIALSGIYPSQT